MECQAVMACRDDGVGVSMDSRGDGGGSVRPSGLVGVMRLGC